MANKVDAVLGHVHGVIDQVADLRSSLSFFRKLTAAEDEDFLKMKAGELYPFIGLFEGQATSILHNLEQLNMAVIGLNAGGLRHAKAA